MRSLEDDVLVGDLANENITILGEKEEQAVRVLRVGSTTPGEKEE